MSLTESRERWPRRGNAGVFGDWPDGCSGPLTREQLAALPDGTEIIVAWSGGNGPHRYRSLREGGQVYARSEHLADPYYNPLTFVGPEPPFTVVRLAPPA